MNIFETINSNIVAALERGVIPWRSGWKGGFPANFATKREYRGINVLLLMLAEKDSPYWMTFNQAKSLGGTVRKGSKGVRVVYWHWRTADEVAKLKQARPGADIAPCYPFVSVVFNASDIDGLESTTVNIPQPQDNQRIDAAEALLGGMAGRPEIHHHLGFVPSYCALEDKIRLPELSQFEGADHYYGTLFHELVHSTAHQSRLSRRGEEETKNQRYSFEELVAEFGAAFLCGLSGIVSQELGELQASYIDGWIKVFKNDPRVLVKAAGEAQKAVDYIRGVVRCDSFPSSGKTEPTEENSERNLSV